MGIWLIGIACTLWCVIELARLIRRTRIAAQPAAAEPAAGQPAAGDTPLAAQDVATGRPLQLRVDRRNPDRGRRAVDRRRTND